MTHAARAAAAVTRDALAAVARLEASDLLVASAIVTVRGPPHLRPLADRLSAAAAQMTTEESHDRDA